MKKLYAILFAVLLSVSVFAQAPAKMSYQAVIRNSSNQLVNNQQVGMQISILQGSTDGTPVYVETQTPTSNANGLVSIEIGGGAGFDAIDWANDIYFIKTETDPTGGATYTITGTSQLLSVPYALHAKTAKDISGTITASQVSDIQTTITNNADVLANTGDNAVNTLYSGLVTNAIHTGDVTGSDALTLATVNSDLGTYNNITINAKGLATAGNNVSYLTSEDDPTVKAINGIVKSDGTTISAATAGTDYLTPTGSATSLINFPILNQNTTGKAATVTTNANLTGDVTSTGNATIIANKQNMTATAPVSITGSPTVIASGAVAISIAAATPSASGSMSAADKTKLNGFENANITAGIGISVTGTYPNIEIASTSPTYAIGLNEDLGGYVIEINADGTHGLVAAMQDQGYIYWFQSNDLLSDANNHDVNGAKFKDWRLPTKRELNLMYLDYINGNGGNFNANNYWSSTLAEDTSHAWSQLFYDSGMQISYGIGLSGRVRAVRAF